MDRKTKILMMVLNKNKDDIPGRLQIPKCDKTNNPEHIPDCDQIPKYESTKGLCEDEINVVCSNRHSLIRDDRCSLNTPDPKNDIQIEEVSSTEKRCMIRQKNGELKRKLFNADDDDIISSTTEGISSGSDSDYIPNSEEISDSENESECSFPEVPIEKNPSSNILHLQRFNDIRVEKLVSEDELNLVETSTLGISHEETEKPKKKVTKRKWNKRDYCFFCNTDVLKFSRHILRHHQSEIEVQEILALSVRDRKRKFLFNKLRNEGNFVKSSADENVVPVRKPASHNFNPPTISTYLPCKYCKGFYKKKYLYRHVKNCPHNCDDKTVRINAQTEGQSLFSTCRNDDILRREIFPIMRADTLSFAAKTNPLICAVARRYLKSHRDKQFKLVASRKMRQLAALLLEMKKKIKVRSLLEALDPSNFDIIIESTKIISKYDAETQSYGAPSLAANMGTQTALMSLILYYSETVTKILKKHIN